MWECGLKLSVCPDAGKLKGSLPMWECGLKPLYHSRLAYRRNVTPHVGVWIETDLANRRELWEKVTPHVGAWIETYEDNPKPRK